MTNLKAKPLERRRASEKIQSISPSATLHRATTTELSTRRLSSQAKPGGMSTVGSSKHIQDICTDVLKSQAEEIPASPKISEIGSKAVLKLGTHESLSERKSAACSSTKNIYPENVGLLPRQTETRAATALKTKSGLSSSKDRTHSHKHPSLHVSKDTVQRLTNGGIANVSPRNKRRHSFHSTDLTMATVATPDSVEPKPILKSATILRRASLVLGEISRFSKTRAISSTTVNSAMTSFCECSSKVFSSSRDNNTMTSDLTLEPWLSDKDVLRKCQYRLTSGSTMPVKTGLKKVAFSNNEQLLNTCNRSQNNMPSGASPLMRFKPVEPTGIDTRDSSNDSDGTLSRSQNTTKNDRGNYAQADNRLAVLLYTHIKNQRRLEEKRIFNISRAERERQKFKQKLEASSSRESPWTALSFSALWSKNNRSLYGKLLQRQSNTSVSDEIQ